MKIALDNTKLLYFSNKIHTLLIYRFIGREMDNIMLYDLTSKRVLVPVLWSCRRKHIPVYMYFMFCTEKAINKTELLMFASNECE